MSTIPYRPLGTLVIVKILPVQSDSPIILPDGKSNPKVRQTFEVIAVGDRVNDDKYQLNVGEIVMIAAHNSDFLPLDEEKQWALIDRSKIILAVEKNQQN